MEQLPFRHIGGDIAIPCTKCDEYVDVRNLREHRETHRVWKILRCNAETVPKTMKQLLKRRRQIINEVMGKSDPDNPLPAKLLQKIDWAFEAIRKTVSKADGQQHTDLSPRSRTLLPQSRALNEEVKATGESFKLNSCGQSVGICHNQNEAWRTTDEDRYTFIENCIGKVEHGFFGLFDGYNGAIASEKCSKHFYDMFIEELALEDNDLNFAELVEQQLAQRQDFVKEALRKSFFKMDAFLLTGEFESSKLRWSGTSATVCYLEDDTLYVANSGNVRGLFVKGDGSAVKIIQDHTLQNKKERERLKKNNATLSFSAKASLVNGLLTSTRGLGNHGDPALKSSVITKPSVSSFKIDADDQFLIFYTAGIWDVLNDDEVMFLLEDIMPDTSEIDTLREHLLKQELRNEDENSLEAQLPKIDEISVSGNQSEPVNKEQDEPVTDETKIKTSSETGQEDKLTEIEKNSSFEKTSESRRDEKSYKESKSCFLARALVERLAYGALLAGSRENITAMVVLLQGCPINLYLLPSVKRKSVIQRKFSSI